MAASTTKSGGLFISFEGGEGSGKSTQARILGDRLRALGREVVLTREPGGCAFAETVRQLILDPATPPHGALSEALLFYAARAAHLDAVIRPALAAGKVVISDRFSDSTRVYQGAAGGLDPKAIDTLEKLVVGADAPNVTLILDVPADFGLARARVRGSSDEADRFEARELQFHSALRDGFRKLAVAEPGRCAVIDATGDIETVAARVWSAVSARLGVV